MDQTGKPLGKKLLSDGEYNMGCKRSELIELIEEIDGICVDSSPIITELIQWLPTSTIETFIEDAKTALEIADA